MSDTLGEITVTATATDAAGNTVTVPRVLRVIDPNDGDPPQLTLTSLVDGQVVRAPLDIVGTITDNVAELLTYELTATPFNAWSHASHRRWQRSARQSNTRSVRSYDPG